MAVCAWLQLEEQRKQLVIDRRRLQEQKREAEKILATTAGASASWPGQAQQ